MTRAERYAQFKPLRDQGLIYREIAERTGVAKSTVHDILMDPTGEKALARKQKRHAFCKDCGVKVWNSGSTPPERCGDCRHKWERTIEARHAQSARQRGRLRWTDEQIFAAIRSTAVDGVVSITGYQRAYEQAPKGSMPSTPIIVRRFDTWGEAVEAAGVTTRVRCAGPRRDRTPKEECLQSLLRCVEEMGVMPSYKEYEEWNGYAPGEVDAQTVRIRFGSWMAAVDAALAEQVAA